jgi:transposase
MPGRILLIVDQPATIGALPVAVAQAAGVTVGYLSGLSMRRIADLHPGESKTDARDAFIIAEAARTMPQTLCAVRGTGRAVDAGHLASYAGLSPVTWRSGSSIRGDHASHRGNKALNRVLYLSAFASLKDPACRAYYDRKRREGKRPNQALVALARRRCDTDYAMLRAGTIYQPRSAA